MITVGIIGFGLSGRYLQAPFFLHNPNFKLKTIVTNNQNPADIYPSVQKATSLDAVIADAEIDLVTMVFKLNLGLCKKKGACKYRPDKPKPMMPTVIMSLNFFY